MNSSTKWNVQCERHKRLEINSCEYGRQIAAINALAFTYSRRKVVLHNVPQTLHLVSSASAFRNRRRVASAKR